MTINTIHSEIAHLDLYPIFDELLRLTNLKYMQDLNMHRIKGKKLTNKDFIELEIELQKDISDIRLPEDFKEFYLKYNGGGRG